MTRTIRTRTGTGRPLAAAVALVVAVTGGAVSATPALAATPAATGAPTAGTQEREPVSLPTGNTLRGGGPSGFLSSDAQLERFSWTRYADGVTVELPAGRYRGAVGSDVVVKENGPNSFELYDMATGADPVPLDTAFLGSSTRLLRSAGKTLVMQALDASGNASLHLLSVQDGKAVDRVVAGLPADARFVTYDLNEPGVFALAYTGTVGGAAGKWLASVDLATGTITDRRALPAVAADVAASATHLAWSERSADGQLTVVSARHGETGTVRTPIGAGDWVRVDLMGDWVTYTRTGGAEATEPNPLFPLKARPLAGGTPITVMESTEVLYGSEQVQGGTAAHGEGVYRIAPGADGKPVATLRASNGRATVLDLTGQQVPAVLDFRKEVPWPTMTWYLNRGNALVQVDLIHKATGKRWTSGPSYAYGDVPRYTTSWDGAFDDYTAARNGAYTWKLTAKPRNGVGPDLVRTGTLTVDSGTAPHDYSDSGAPDLLVRNDSGRLLSYDFRQILTQYLVQPERTDRGTGWNVYDRLVATGDVAGSRFADVVGRDRTGVLWFYQGTGAGLARRVQVGGGWQTYDKLTAGSDLTGDGRADLVATDRSGVLWLYTSTGSATRPFAPRKRIGGGWQTYDKLTATGNIAGGRGGDLVARDRDGVLWLYLGKGDGTFTARTRVGGGWQQYDEIIGIGDADRDGRPDLLVEGETMYGAQFLSFYKGTGDARAPFSARKKLWTLEELNNDRGLVF
ncbi:MULTISPECIES: VCBS repeat-containing protein [unclassified Streptomyces]|uniref:FG-GAP repeat domain-containing protein n=1 Tax=unclassified Streptomyces TaxID=2593676 RepID=UPI00332F6D45